MKMRWILITAILAAVLCLTVGPAALAAAGNRYIEAGIENGAEFEKAFGQLQNALAANDRHKVSEYILFPLRVNGWTDEIKGKMTAQFATKQEVLDNFEVIFTPVVREAILKQKTADLSVSWQGVMVGKGEAWLSVSEKDPHHYGIFAVNLSF